MRKRRRCLQARGTTKHGAVFSMGALATVTTIRGIGSLGAAPRRCGEGYFQPEKAREGVGEEVS